MPKLKASRVPDDTLRKQEKYGSRHIRDENPLLSYVLDQPPSSISQMFRHVNVVAGVSQRGRGVRRLGVTSTLPGEGTTTIAANFSRLTASTGQGVLLIDCNYQDPALSRAFCPDAAVGLIDLLETGQSLSSYLWLDGRTGMHFLPVGGSEERYRRSQAIWSEPMAILLEQLTQVYDYVVVDLPSLASVAEVGAAAEFLDQILLVVEWNKVSEDQVQAGLGLSGAAGAKLLGMIFNKVDVSALNKLGSSTGSFLALHPSRPCPEPAMSGPVAQASLVSRKSGGDVAHPERDAVVEPVSGK